MGKVKLTIDDHIIEASEGQSILEAALQNDIYIPHICTHPDLPVQGNCKLCVVEIQGREGYPCSCETKAEEGMKVITKSPALSQKRGIAMELMLAGHPHDCSTCKRYGKCEFQAMLQYLGTVHSRMRTVHSKTASINTQNPVIVREMERCIRCGRCVRMCGDVRKVGIWEFKQKDGETYIGTADDVCLSEADCRFCSACVEVCPTGALQDAPGLFREDIPKEEALVPCTEQCPAHIDIPAYVRLVKEGKYSEAVGVIREKVPFPHALGYVCNHRCEAGCKRSALNEAVSIRDLKRFAVEHDEEKVWASKGFQKPPTGKRVAVAGGGPAGMTAAYYLHKLGHEVTVFEKQKIAGGHMTGGMPEYRIPTQDVKKELDFIEKSGVQIVCGHTVTSAESLRKEYDAVLVAVGTSVGKKLNYLPGSEFKQVYTAVDLLRGSRQHRKMDLGSRCCVIGGGNVAVDVARTLVRMGVSCRMICLEQGVQMKSDPEELREAIEEGVIVLEGYSNESIQGTQDQVTGLKVHRIHDFYFDSETRKLVENPVLDSTEILPCDSIVFAAGQETGLTEEFGLQLNRFGYPVNPRTGSSDYLTSMDGVFCAGDVITGTRFVIDAVAGGREAARRIDCYLGGDGNIDETLVERTRDAEIGKINHFCAIGREYMPVKPAEKRRDNFEPVSEGFSCEQAGCEAARCLQCDLRKDISRVNVWSDYGNR
jgi:formate dehydrogenase beta subunit